MAAIDYAKIYYLPQKIAITGPIWMIFCAKHIIQISSFKAY